MGNNLPTHIAVIPDGNRRWSKLHGLSAIEGHRRGAEVMHQVIDELIQLGGKYLTVWGFSKDNWKRTPEELDSLFDLLGLWIQKDIPWLHNSGVRVKHMGRLYELPPDLQELIVDAVNLTGHNPGMTLNLAFNYTGRAEILDAVNRLVRDALPYQVDEEVFSRYLYISGIPDVDLVIRTADEFRLSNFMLWQIAYSEFYFTPVLWPDFNSAELEKALEAYATRQRRFGGD